MAKLLHVPDTLLKQLPRWSSFCFAFCCGSSGFQHQQELKIFFNKIDHDTHYTCFILFQTSQDQDDLVAPWRLTTIEDGSYDRFGQRLSRACKFTAGQNSARFLGRKLGWWIEGNTGVSNIKLDSHAVLLKWFYSFSWNKPPSSSSQSSQFSSSRLGWLMSSRKCLMCKLRVLSGIDSMEIFLMVFLRADFGARNRACQPLKILFFAS